MRISNILGLLLTFFFSCVNANVSEETSNENKCEKCDVAVVRNTEDHLKKLSGDEITCFLLGFNKSCENNVEYSEYSNEILFKVVLNYPKKVVDILSENTDIDKIYLYKILSMPLLDNPPIEGVIKAVEELHTDNLVVKKEIITALKRAAH